MAQFHSASCPRSPRTPDTAAVLHPSPALAGLLLAGLLAGCGATPESPDAQTRSIARRPIPETARNEKIGDDYHGTWVADPYRWLENQDGTDTAAWTAEQNRWTQDYLAGVSQRDTIRQRLAELR